MLPYGGRLPCVHADAWIAPGAVVIGDVEIGAGSSVWYGAVVRGDVHAIRIGARTNLQDQTVVHVTAGRFGTRIGDEVTVGHRAVVHGCTVRDGALVGIGSIVLDGADVGEEAWVAAGALVSPGTKVPPRALVRGVPARVVRTLDAAEIEAQRARTLEYVATAARHAARAGA
ncbi:MAG: gamma carbonic anhydrase family protein [Proteobacteria bacterium]|nr:MAG: gamma carbonic anhydrase family protein [Pseudomonadota bacterium]